MNEGHSCDLAGAPVAVGEAPVSRVMRFRPASAPQTSLGWEGIEPAGYKAPAAHHCGVVRHTLVGEQGERTAYHVRYFEISPGGNTSRERHEHEHFIIVLRGGGRVLLGEQTHEIGYGDAVYVAPNEIHQLANPSTEEPFGFLCLVDARRDVPRAVGELGVIR